MVKFTQMPRYDFECQSCKGLTVVFWNQKRPLDHGRVKCEFCGNDKLRLNAFYESVDAQILELQMQIEDIRQRLGSLDDQEIEIEILN